MVALGKASAPLLPETFDSSFPAQIRVARAKGKPWIVEVEEKRQLVVAALMGFLASNLCASIVGRQITNKPIDEQMLSVHDSVRAKSTNTVRQRVCNLLQFERYLAGSRDGPCIPFYEAECYDYVCHLRSIAAAPTRAGRFLEALRFAHHVLGVDVEADLLLSKRIEGAVLASMSRKRMLQQREALQVKQVVALEKWLVEKGPREPALANVVGALLFCLHTRSRWGDIMGIHEEPCVDGAWMEARTSYHKTYNRPERRHKWLPMAGLSKGVSGLPWCAQWLAIRKSSGAKASPGKPFISLPNLDETWSEVKMSSSEATVTLRQTLLHLGFAKELVDKQASHSLKATLLSWCAKAGVGMDDRRLLGNHIARKDVSVLCYSRDTLSAPLRRLKTVVDKIRDGKFLPDETRSGMWTGESQASASTSFMVPTAKSGSVPVPRPLQTEKANEDFLADQALERMAEVTLAANVDVVESNRSDGASVAKADEAESASSEESSSDEERSRLTLQNKVSKTLYRMPAESGDASVVWVHMKYGTFHMAKFEDPNQLACGRVSADKYRVLKFGETIGLPKCRVCFGFDDAG